MNKFGVLAVIIVVVAAGFLILKGGGQTPEDSAPVSDNSGSITITQNNASRNAQDKNKNFPKAPDFSLKDFKGNTASLADFKGRPLVINSWAVWCPFCVKELKDFSKAQKEFGDKITIIAIDRAESLSTAKKFTDDAGITETLVFLLDPSDSFYRSISGFSMPETIFIDTEGNIRFHKRGPMELDEMRQRINSLLKLD